LDSLVPWVATPTNIAKEMLQIARVGVKDVVYDLGCGDARILIMAVKEFGAKKAIGYEIREDLYETSMHNIESQNLQDKITLLKKDLFDADLSEASVITLYLSAKVNELLRPKLEREAKRGTRIVSYSFKINAWRRNKKQTISRSPGVSINLYVVPQTFRAPNVAR